jgi:adenine-specific DNA-methyltransferase
MSDNLEKFQHLLRELFQFDCADLDFGIYRIMNYKRKVIERFITEDLPTTITEELAQGALVAQSQAAQALEDAQKKVIETLGKDALDANGNLAGQYHTTPVGKEYLDAQRRARGSRSRNALEADIYNHLFTFFSRYWQDGDFISKRRYSRKERYAIPYNGEEVYFYWANHDQYYIKTGEHFTDYTYKHPNGVTVHFKLRQANTEQNNVKGEKRFFLPRLDEIAWDETRRVITIPFEYRPLNVQESITYKPKQEHLGQSVPAVSGTHGNANGQKNGQEAIIASAVVEIPQRVTDSDARAALIAEKRRDANNQPVSYLEHHLRQYTRRNTADFFIHKDLKGFLSRELDFYLKNEVLNLDEMEAAGEQLSEGWFQLVRLIKHVGARIIEFLAQIEDFQKMLWEKKKFVTETFYLIAIGAIPDAFYQEIAECEAQWEEWKTLVSLDEAQTDLFTNGASMNERRVACLKTHPTLMLDTRHFPPDFTDRLLASFEHLDEMTDGLLVHSENWQALNLLQEKYRERVKCIYIDPPYNTGSDEFLYKDGYQSSSWASMIVDRAAIARTLICSDGLFHIQIGDEENARLRILMETLFPERKNSVVVRRGIKNVQAQFTDISRLSLGYDVIHVYSNRYSVRLPHLKHAHETEKPGKWDTFWRGTDRPSMRYDLFGQLPEKGQWRWEEKRARKAVQNYEYYLKHESHRKSLDEWYVENIQAGVNLDFVRINDDGIVQYYVPPQGYRLISDNWLDMPAAGSFTEFPTEKHTELLQRVIAWNTESGDLALDYYAGSGTTGHAVINLNREDGGRRTFILVEMAHYFDTVLLPRIKKVTFTPEWKDGNPKRMATAEEAERSPRIVKVIRLESYEDALNNLTFDDESGQQALELFGDDYLLSYMLKWETRHSETLLNIEHLQSPFSYTLHLHCNGETRARAVDLPETFNYLLGLDVQTRQVYDDNGRRYLVYRGMLRDGRVAVVIWRDIAGWGTEDYERDAAFVANHNLTAGAAEIYVNGDSRIPGAHSLDRPFKARMFSSMEG